MRGPRRRACADRSACAGFTLIELLIALTLFGLISVVLFGGLRFGTRAWEAGHAHAERLAEVQAVQALLRRHISQAVVPQSTGGEATGTEAPAAFDGAEEALSFVALVPARIGVGGFYRFELRLADTDDGARLELAWRLFRPDDPERLGDPEPGLGGRRVLIQGIERARFAYFGAERAEQVAEWRERWDEPASLPALVAIEVEFPAGDPRSWPELLVAPRLATATP